VTTSTWRDETILRRDDMWWFSMLVLCQTFCMFRFYWQCLLFYTFIIV